MRDDLLSGLRPAFVLTLLFAALLGLVYPAVLTGAAQALFPWQANGSLVTAQGRVVGSALIGQSFREDRNFHGRPSAAGAGYDALASSGSNLGPASAALDERVRGTLAALAAANPESAGRPIPVDLATASASGLDPHISPAAATYQADRVARARGLAPARVRAIVAAQVETPLFGLLGEPRVNVLALNRALDALSPAATTAAPPAVTAARK